MFLILATVRFSLAVKSGQQYVRISYLRAVIHLMHHTHCCLHGGDTLILPYVWYEKEADGTFLSLDIK